MNGKQWPDETPVGKEELIRVCSDPDVINYVCLLLRPGFYGWMVELEYTRFKPDTDANDDFHLSVSAFPEKHPIPQLAIGTVTIDCDGKEYADSLLWKHGLKKSEPGMALKCFGPDGEENFFIHGPNTVILENHSKGAENVIYTNDQKKIQAAFEHERAMVEHFFEEHLTWIETPEGKAIADAYWKKHPGGRVY
jgi:hypothetical protein